MTHKESVFTAVSVKVLKKIHGFKVFKIQSNKGRIISSVSSGLIVLSSAGFLEGKVEIIGRPLSSFYMSAEAQ